jgi:hypothetical protein
MWRGLRSPHDGQDLLRGGDVEARRPGRDVGQVELRGKGSRRCAKAEATALMLLLPLVARSDRYICLSQT